MIHPRTPTIPRRRLERMQATLLKLVAQLESCKLLLDDIRKEGA